MNLNLIKHKLFCAVLLIMPFLGHAQTDCDNDLIAPIAICQESISVVLQNGSAIIDESMIDAGSVDDCGIASISLNQYEFDCSDVTADLSQFISFSKGPVPIEILGKDGFLGFTGSNSYSTIKDGFESDRVAFFMEEINGFDPNVYCVEIKADDFSNVVSMQYTIDFDSDYLAYNGANNVGLIYFADQNIGQNGSTLGISWVSLNILDGETLPNGTTLFSLCFDVIDSNEASTVLVVSDEAGNTSACVTMVDVLDEEAPTLTCNSVIASIDAQGSIQLNPEDVVLEILDDCAINAYHFDHLVYDCSDYYSKEKLAPYFTNQPLNPEIIGVNGLHRFKGLSYFNTLELGSDNLYQETLFEIQESSDNPSTVCFEVSVTEFDSIVGMQFSLSYDSDLLNFQGLSSFIDNFTSSNYSNVLPGLLSISWNSIDASTGISFADDSVILNLCFEKNMDLSSSNTLTVSDLSGNSATCSFDVEVNDTIEPVLELNNVILSLGEDGFTGLDQMSFIDLVSDNCGVAQISFSDQIVLSCEDIATIPDVNISPSSSPAIIEFINKDSEFLTLVDILSGDTLANGSSGQEIGLNIVQSSGNEAYEVCYDFLVEGFEDVIGFQFSVNYDADILSYNGLGSSDLAYFSAQNINQPASGSLIVSWNSLDIENGVSVPAGFNLFSICYDYLGSIGVPVEVEALDYFGNTTAVTAYAVVVDNVGPSIICEKNRTVYLDEDGIGLLDNNELVLELSDNCTAANIQSEQFIFSCEDLGISIITIESSDNYGNMSSCEVIIEVKDNITPVLDCGSIVLTDLSDGVGVVNSQQAIDFVYDNCILLSTVLSDTVFDCSSVLENEVKLLSAIDSGVLVEFANAEEEILTTDIILNGQIETFGIGDSSLELQIVPAGVSTANNIYCYDILVKGFSNIISFQFGLEFDDEISSLLSTTAVDLEDDTFFSATGIGNSLGILWYAVDLLNGESLEDGSVLASICYNTEADFSANTVVVTATDGSGNSSICETTISVFDQIAPLANCSDLEVSLSLNSDNFFDAIQFDAGSVDNCCLESLTAVRNNPVCDGVFEFSDSVLFCAEDLGQEVVVLLKATDCSGNSSICESLVSVEDEFTSTDDLLSANQFQVYPNPVNNRIFIDLKLYNDAEYIIRISSMDGRVIEESIQFFEKGQNQKIIDSSSFGPGVYFVEIFSSTEIWTTKITKL